MTILFKYCVDVKNCRSFRGFGFIYIYIYIYINDINNTYGMFRWQDLGTWIWIWVIKIQMPCLIVYKWSNI